MSDGIKRMLAERAAVVEARKPRKVRAYDGSAHLFSMINRAAPFMDEGIPSNQWRPSEILKVAFCIMATGATGPKRAVEIILPYLERSRQLWLDGFVANPLARELIRASDSDTNAHVLVGEGSKESG